MNKEFKTSAGVITTEYYDDGMGKGVQILLNGDIVCMLDVMENGTRLIVYGSYCEDEPTDIIDINKDKRCGFHCTFTTWAPHLKMELASGEKRIWVECEVENYTTYDRPESQGGKWVLAQKMKIIRVMDIDEVKMIQAEYGLAS